MNLLSSLLPKAIQWAQEQENHVLKYGRALTKDEIMLAEKVGVSNIEKVRIFKVSSIPQPTDPELKTAATLIGLCGPNILGMAFGHGIFIIDSEINNSLLKAHELRHVYQVEQSASLDKFVSEYLTSIIDVGYQNSHFEQDARKHEFMGVTKSYYD